MPYCADSGSDWNIISHSHVKELQALDQDVVEVELDEPVELEAVGGAVLTATQGVDVYLCLNTAAGPVRCQDPKRCLIVKSDDDELIVGRVLLAELGIDVDRELEQLAVRNLRDDDEFGDPTGIPVREETLDEEVATVIDGMITDCLERGIVSPGAEEERLRAILFSFNGWRLVLGDDPPAKVPPLKIRLKPGAKPFKCKARQYSPEKSEFMAKFNAELVRLGWVIENKESRWACAALPVRKPNSDDFRQANDYRPVNSLSEAIAGLMPSLQVRLEKCKGKKFYAIFDFIKGFWQLPLHKDSQELLSYMTDRGIFTPTRVPQGCTDAALHFQSTVEEVLKDYLHECVLVWIDDLLAYADTVMDLMDAIEAILKQLDKFGFKLNPRKCKLFQTEIKWCGRIINKDGVGHDPDRIQALQKIPPPANAAELQQFVCATNWMREGLVDYARVVKPLQERLDESLRGTKRSKRAAADPEKQLCLLSDASDAGWGLIVSQVAVWKHDKPIQEQHHELLICMGGSFSGSALNWSVIEKECFPIVHAFEEDDAWKTPSLVN
uniref:Reverse transcriptase domain-containing protein n=1 Tax=Phytophthora ramorum TaxID=164328 RepID=H3H5Q5_PHYRM